jgi:FixJ family two-component response regulator
LLAQLVAIVESDDAVRESLELILALNRFGAESYALPHEFLDHADIDRCACFVFNENLPGMSGLELLEILRSRRITTPAIILAGQRNCDILNRAQRAGALAVLQKPVAAPELIDWVGRALGHL